MKNLSKFLLLLIVFFLFSIWHLAFSIEASDDNPIPPRPIIPCDPTEVDDPEFNSLRPYQSHPCGKAKESLFCGNKIIITEIEKRQKQNTDRSVACQGMLSLNSTVKGPWENGTANDPKDYWIDMTDLELPILGNTQDVQNSQKENDQLNDAQKMNEYVSWYLNGVINRAEYGENKNTPTELVNFSGPINKLMPSMLLEAQRIETIKNPKDEEGKEKGSSSHNQIVACAKEEGFGWLGNLLDIGKTVPVECYQESGDKYRLVDDKKLLSKNRSWEGDLSFWNNYTNTIVDLISGLLPNVARNVIEESIGNHWNKRTPPLPWADENGKPFEKDVLYRKAYNEWKGKTCVLIPIFDFLICFENIFVPNKYADLYPYIPLANTSDNHYPIPVGPVTVQGGSGVTIVEDIRKTLENGQPILYYPHAIGIKELTDFLNKTYLSSAPSETVDPKTSEINSYNRSDHEQCRTIDVRTNEGDNLFPIGGKEGKQDIGVEIYFKVEELPEINCESHINNQGELVYTGTYYGEVNIEIHTDPVKVPNADQIWQNTVSSETSTFRRIFPKVEKGAPVECIADIPGVSKVAYTPVEGTDKIGVKSLTNPEEKYDPLNAKLHFPHLGSVYEYFLKGIQTALRPKGYGDPIPNGMYCKTEETTNKDVCEIAEEYNIPCCRIMGQMGYESGWGKITGSGSCGKFNCCNGIGCGPGQISCNAYASFNGNDNLDLCSVEGSAELMARAFLLKLCQADGYCTSYDWVKYKDYVLEHYSISESDDYRANAYYAGLENGCAGGGLTGCTQFRWGDGVGYCHAMDYYCKNVTPPNYEDFGALIPEVNDYTHCEDCNIELINSGVPPMQCKPSTSPTPIPAI